MTGNPSEQTKTKLPTLTKHQSAVIYLKGRSSENPIEVQENCQQIKTSNGSKIIKPKAAHKNMIAENEGKDTKQVNNFPHKKDKLPIDKAYAGKVPGMLKNQAQKEGGNLTLLQNDKDFIIWHR